uniref:Uncharacterized protein n=1 Tax=Glossina palpalis gambiensis TaxID=67801 RepID=A0A1B0C4K4_9MUSC
MKLLILILSEMITTRHQKSEHRFLQELHITTIFSFYSNADKRSARLHGCCTRCARWPKVAKDANDEDDHLVAVNAVLQLNQSIDISCNDM